MSQLIDTSLLGSSFVQDKNPAYIKIDRVVLGESLQYGYKVIMGTDITAILNTCLADPKVVAVVYNWSAGVAYIKSGFNLNNTNDSAVNASYTTFVVLDRVASVPATQPQPIPVVPPATSTPSTIRLNEFLRTDGGNFSLNGRVFVPVGLNAFFLGLMQETMAYPTKAQITEIFEAARTMKATVIRSHTLGFSAQNSMTLLDANNNINSAAWAPIDWAYAEAKRCSIKLIIVLCDPYEYYHGSLDTFCKPYGVAKDQFFISPVARTAFKKYINQYLSHVNQFTGYAIKDNIVVACLELGNELGNIREEAGSMAIPTQDWIADISSYIKSLTKILVLNGSDECLGSATSNDFAIASIDVYSQHFYWVNTNEINAKSNSAKALVKPYIIGEYSSQFSDIWYTTIESNKNVKGSCVWSLYPHDNSGKRIHHSDGFTFWFDRQDSSNTQILLRLTNHFRRMQSLPVVTSF